MIYRRFHSFHAAERERERRRSIRVITTDTVPYFPTLRVESGVILARMTANLLVYAFFSETGKNRKIFLETPQGQSYHNSTISDHFILLKDYWSTLSLLHGSTFWWLSGEKKQLLICHHLGPDGLQLNPFSCLEEMKLWGAKSNE